MKLTSTSLEFESLIKENQIFKSGVIYSLTMEAITAKPGSITLYKRCTLLFGTFQSLYLLPFIFHTQNINSHFKAFNIISSYQCYM